MKHNACVLIAQNDQFFFENCKNFLLKYNIITVYVENNYHKIISTIKTHKPDVVLLDSIVPPFDSIAVMNALKFIKNESFKMPVFFVLSCINDIQLKNANLAAGALEYLVKPVDNYVMLIRVFNVIIASQLQKEANIDLFSKHYIANNSLCAPEDLEYLIFQILNEFSIPINMNGYNYLCKAILYNILNLPSNISLTKQIYPMVAKDVNSSAACIEHSIRHTINTAWQNGENKKMVEYFGNKRPTNMLFINLISKLTTLKKAQNPNVS